METREENELYKELINLPFVYRDKINILDDMFFGCEIEFSIRNRKDAEKTIRDVILSQKGEKKFYKLTHSNKVSKLNQGQHVFEIKTPVLHNTEEDFKSLKNVCDHFKKLDIAASDQKGVHVHVNMSSIENNTRFLNTFLKLFCLYEHIIFRFSYGEEYDSNINQACYSRVISNTLYNYLKTHDNSCDFNESIEDLRDLLTCKSYALNFHKQDLSCKNDTIEVRTFNSTMNPTIIQNDISFLLNMVDQIVNNNIDLDFLDYKFDDYDKGFYKKESYSRLNLSDAVEFSDMIFREDEDRNYFLKQYAIKTTPKKKKLVI